jgi:hypothetical protein
MRDENARIEFVLSAPSASRSIDDDDDDCLVVRKTPFSWLRELLFVLMNEDESTKKKKFSRSLAAAADDHDHDQDEDGINAYETNVKASVSRALSFARRRDKRSTMTSFSSPDGRRDDRNVHYTWRNKENVLGMLLPIIGAEYAKICLESFLPPLSKTTFEEEEKAEAEAEAEAADDDDENVMKIIKNMNEEKLKQYYDEFFELFQDILSYNEREDLEMFQTWVENKIDLAKDDFKLPNGEKKRLRRRGRELIPSLLFNEIKKDDCKCDDDIESFLKRRNEELQPYRLNASRNLYASEVELDTKSKFLAIVLEGFRHDRNENLLNELFFPRDPNNKDDVIIEEANNNEEDDDINHTKFFNNKTYLTVRAFCSEPTNAKIVERCFSEKYAQSRASRRILRLCSDGCFDSEKYLFVENVQTKNDYEMFCTTGDTVTKCTHYLNAEDFVCVRWMCRTKFEVNDVARKSFQDVFAEVAALEILKQQREQSDDEEDDKDEDRRIRRTITTESGIETTYSFGTLRDYGACEDFLCVATDWVDGVGLNQWRSEFECSRENENEKRKRAVELLFTFTETILSMVCEMHENDVVHYDLKLEHFIVSKSSSSMNKFTITLIDFGECAVYDALDEMKGTTRARGTEIYQAPEMLLVDVVPLMSPSSSAKGEVTKRTTTKNTTTQIDGKKCDCYALGVAICELFFNNSPNRQTYEQTGFLDMLDLVSAEDDGNAFRNSLENIACVDFKDEKNDVVVDWLLQTLLVRDCTKRASAHEALDSFKREILITLNCYRSYIQ